MKKIYVLLATIFMFTACSNDDNNWQDLDDKYAISCDNGFTMTIEEYEEKVDYVDFYGGSILIENNDDTSIVLGGTSCITNTEYISF